MMTLTTPALLFPAISLLLLAYTNRFLSVATIIRQMHPGEGKRPGELARQQIPNLRYRVSLIRDMQSFGVLSFLLCAISMFAIFIQRQFVGQLLFGLSLVSLATSLLMSFVEVLLSTKALKVVLDDMQGPRQPVDPLTAEQGSARVSEHNDDATVLEREAAHDDASKTGP